MIILVLNLYGVNTTSLIAGLGVAGVVLGFALQEALKDFINDDDGNITALKEGIATITATYVSDNSIKEESAKVNHVIAYPEGYDTISAGPSSFANSGDHEDSPYFSQLDVYNLKSTDTLTILSEFETYQQTTEVTCGPASALMVLNHFGENNYDELEIAEMMKCHKDLNGNNTEEPGVANEQGEIGTSIACIPKHLRHIFYF